MTSRFESWATLASVGERAHQWAVHGRERLDEALDRSEDEEGRRKQPVVLPGQGTNRRSGRASEQDRSERQPDRDPDGVFEVGQTPDMDEGQEGVCRENGSGAPPPPDREGYRRGCGSAEETRRGSGIALVRQQRCPQVSVVGDKPQQQGRSDDRGELGANQGQGSLRGAQTPLGEAAKDGHSEQDGQILQGLEGEEGPRARSSTTVALGVPEGRRSPTQKGPATREGSTGLSSVRPR